MLTANGYREVERTWSKNGADIECVASDGRKTYVTCLNSGGWVLENSIRDALDDLHSGMIPGVDEPPERAIIVTAGWFIRDALRLAKRHADGITLIDGQQLVSMMQRVQPH
jgi:hypothetical protein